MAIAPTDARIARVGFFNLIGVAMDTSLTRYAVGIDVGDFSVGMAAIKVGEDGMPQEILSAISHIHDSGLDPDNIQEARTRLEISGIARRTRRLFRHRRRRLIRLDAFIQSKGWGLPQNDESDDPYLPWRVRAELASRPIPTEEELGAKLSIAIRHIARHRGWRNPYSRVSSLMADVPPSDAFKAVQDEFSKILGRSLADDMTLGQMVAACNLTNTKLRGKGGAISARLQQSDFAHEIRKICAMQEIDESTVREIIEHVFVAESPRSANAARVGKDPLQPSEDRALKATDAFQRYRIAALIGNLRVREGSGKRELSFDERKLVFDHLVHLEPKIESDWSAVAEKLNISRRDLLGTATTTDDGERAGARPPVHETNRRILTCSVKPLVKWWQEADDAERREMLIALGNGSVEDYDSAQGAKVQAFFIDLPDEDIEKLDKLQLPVGRAAYSEDTLTKLTEAMLSNGVDLYTARRQVFGISEDWEPPVPEIGEPVGNPAVDRVLKVVARWLRAAENTWGVPESINIEHVRAGFMSESKSRELDRDNERRAKRNLELFTQMQQKFGQDIRPSRADLWRYQSVQRQNGQCCYCGATITYQNCEMDHIVPRAGRGSTNTRDNLVAVCHDCNLSKGNTPFAVWAEKSTKPGVSVAEAQERLRHWVCDPGLKTPQFRRFVKSVNDRLSRKTIDEELDARSIESVAWMANELRGRIAHKYQDAKVRVFRGQLTAEARKASGISKKIAFIDGPGKSRLDRRHHAVDAAVIAFMSAKVAETLAIRSNLKFDQELRKDAPQWKEFTGSTDAHKIIWSKWRSRMIALADLLQTALDEDRIVVMSNLRLRLGNGAVHEEKIRKLKKLKVGGPISAVDVDRASTEALWCALTRHPDFDPKEGLPADPDRNIRVQGRHLSADDTIEVFPVSAGAVAVRGGYVKLGRSFHHARVYKIVDGNKVEYAMLRVYSIDLNKYKNEDLFTVELQPQTMTMRKCKSSLRKALAAGKAEYLGWLVVDDELYLDTAKFNTGQIVNIQEELGKITRWRVDGFKTESKLRLRPLQMSKEGIRKDMSEDVNKILDSEGWQPTVNKLFGVGKVTVIRRDALGRVRLSSNAHLPVTWTTG